MLQALGSASCDIAHDTRGTISYVHWVLHHVISHTRQGARFVTDTRDTGYDLLRALGSASCDITHETGGTTCYAHWESSSSDITHETEGYGWLRTLGSASCGITHETAGTMCYRHCVLRLVISLTRQGVRLCSARCDSTHETGGTICYGHTRHGVRFVMGSASCDITDETGGTICYAHWGLHLVISHTRQRVRFGTDIWFCIL